MNLSNSEIQKRITNLPDNIRNAILGFDWASEIMKIGHNHHMHMDEIEIFRQQTLAVILGIFPADKYEDHLIHDVGLSKTIAESIVSEANHRIFRELQKRAFTKIETNTEFHEDEIIEHHEIKNVLAGEGIHLVDEHDVSPINTDLHKEVIEIMSEVHPSDDNPTRTSTNTIHQGTSEQTSHTKHNYQEPIHPKDLKGIHKHRLNTNIINQKHPEQILTQTKNFSTTRDIGQGDYAPLHTLDKKITQETIISNNHTTIIKSDDITGSDNFLDKLGTKRT